MNLFEIIKGKVKKKVEVHKENSRLKQFHETFKYREKYARDKWQDRLDLNEAVLHELICITESGRATEDSYLKEKYVEKGITQELIDEALKYHEELRPEIFIKRIGYASGDFLFERQFYKEAQELYGQKRVSREQLEEGAKGALLKSARKSYELVMKERTNYPDHCGPEYLIYGIENGVFSSNEVKILEGRLDHGEDLPEFKKCYGQGNMAKNLVDKLLSYDPKKEARMFASCSGEECFESH